VTEASHLVAAIEARLKGRSGPLLVAIDGPSGSGKSALAALVAASLDAVIVPSDDFYAAHVTDADWAARSSAERVADVIDWRRLRAEALEPLLAGRTATWYPFDFEAGPRPDGTFRVATSPTTRDPAAVVVLDGAYSSRPELVDLIDLSVFVDVPAAERHRRLVERDGDAYTGAWERRWKAAEDYYFTTVRSPASFDLVVVNEGP
jgi:para-aminobenzoate synthetase